ncbi:calcium-binding protein, partial [Tistrella bauzanensis]
MANITGGTGADRIIGTSANDVLQGRAGDDILIGLAGNDVLHGGTGNDTMDGGLGNDIFEVVGVFDADRFIGGAGTDTIRLSGNASTRSLTIKAADSV